MKVLKELLLFVYLLFSFKCYESQVKCDSILCYMFSVVLLLISKFIL